MSAKQANYRELQAELDEIMLKLQSDDLDVDQALEYYQRGLELARQLEKYLSVAENKIRNLKSKYSAK